MLDVERKQGRREASSSNFALSDLSFPSLFVLVFLSSFPFQSHMYSPINVFFLRVSPLTLGLSARSSLADTKRKDQTIDRKKTRTEQSSATQLDAVF
jgi:hypothetical protein